MFLNKKLHKSFFNDKKFQKTSTRFTRTKKQPKQIFWRYKYAYENLMKKE